MKRGVLPQLNSCIPYNQTKLLLKKEEATGIVLNGYERRHKANRGSLGEIDCLTVPESRQF